MWLNKATKIIIIIIIIITIIIIIIIIIVVEINIAYEIWPYLVYNITTNMVDADAMFISMTIASCFSKKYTK